MVSVHLGPRAGKASISTRIRLADSQKIIAVAEMSDGSFWSDEAEVVVTLAACLEEFDHGPRAHQRSAKAKRGDVIEIKTLISHLMEPGYRPDSTGNVMPRDIINAVRLHL